MFYTKQKDKKKKLKIFNPYEQMPKRTFLGGGGVVETATQKRKEEKMMLTKQERVERIELVASKLKDRYKKFEQAKMFIEYLRATDEVFARAESEHWTIEKTEREMIAGEIYLMSVNTGLDEDVFRSLYDEFVQMNQNARKIQIASKKLQEKYSKEAPEVMRFIEYIRDYFLIFSKSIERELTPQETKEEIIRARMKVLAADGQPPIHVLDNIYREFITMLTE